MVLVKAQGPGLQFATAVSYPAHTQKSMPVHRGNIPRQKDLQRWPYLRHVPLPEIDSEIELLIGLDVAKALEPLQVIRCVDDGPYAVKTILRWTVNGPLGGDSSCETVCKQPQVSVNRISVVRLDELWKQQFKVDFPECAQDEQQGERRGLPVSGICYKVS